MSLNQFIPNIIQSVISCDDKGQIIMNQLHHAWNTNKSVEVFDAYITHIVPINIFEVHARRSALQKEYTRISSELEQYETEKRVIAYLGLSTIAQSHTTRIANLKQLLIKVQNEKQKLIISPIVNIKVTSIPDVQLRIFSTLFLRTLNETLKTCMRIPWNKWTMDDQCLAFTILKTLRNMPDENSKDALQQLIRLDVDLVTKITQNS